MLNLEKIHYFQSDLFSSIIRAGRTGTFHVNLIRGSGSGLFKKQDLFYSKGDYMDQDRVLDCTRM